MYSYTWATVKVILFSLAHLHRFMLDRSSHEWGRAYDHVAMVMRRERETLKEIFNVMCASRIQFSLVLCMREGQLECDITVSASYYNILWLNTNIHGSKNLKREMMWMVYEDVRAKERQRNQKSEKKFSFTSTGTRENFSRSSSSCLMCM
jgi:hypothetical protein